MPQKIERAGRSPGQVTWQPEQDGTARSRAGSSFAARFGRVILQHGIAALPTALYHYGGKLGLYAQHVWFISYILAHKWDEDLPYPSLGAMSRCTGMSKRQLQRYSEELQRAGYLQVLQRVSDGRGQEANAYDFSALFGRIEELLAESRRVDNPIRASAPTDPEMLVELAEAASDPSFVARYGRVIARYGVAAVPRALFTHQHALQLEPQQVWFVAYILSYQWDTALPYPSILKMAEQTGYTPAYLHRIKGSLVASSYLRLVRRTSPTGGQDTNAYDFSGLFDAIRETLQPGTESSLTQDVAGEQPSTSAEAEIPQPSITSGLTGKPRRGSLAAQARKDRVQRTNGNRSDGDPHDTLYTGSGDAAYTEANDKAYMPPRDTQYIEGGDIQYIYPSVLTYTEGNDTQYMEPLDRQSRRPVSHSSQAPATPGSHEIESDHPETNKKMDDSNRLSKGQNGRRKRGDLNRTAAQPATERIEQNPSSIRSDVSNMNPTRQGIQGYSPYIALVATDFSDELQDTDHVVQNVSQALRLWRQSGLEDAQFVALMYEAKQRTRAGQHSSGARGLGNKMAYFFTCLRDLCAR